MIRVEQAIVRVNKSSHDKAHKVLTVEEIDKLIKHNSIAGLRQAELRLRLSVTEDGVRSTRASDGKAGVVEMLTNHGFVVELNNIVMDGQYTGFCDIIVKW